MFGYYSEYHTAENMVFYCDVSESAICETEKIRWLKEESLIFCYRNKLNRYANKLYQLFKFMLLNKSIMKLLKKANDNSGKEKKRYYQLLRQYI